MAQEKNIMPVKVFSGAIFGFDAFPIDVEVDTTPGLHFFNIVGLPDKTVEESKDRIASAVKNSGFVAPNRKNQRIIINLAPADVKKEGPAFDLPITLGYLLASKQISFDSQEKVFLGELSLDGSLRSISGILPLALMAASRGFKELIIPHGNIEEASVVKGLKIIGAPDLKSIINHLSGKEELEPSRHLDYESLGAVSYEDDFDIAEIRGQESAKRALTVAASGGHNILMHGPPGSGKTLLAKSLSSILPKMSYPEALEVTKVYSVSGLMRGQTIMTKRPFRNPHHKTSAVAVIGGGAWPKPGEISLAHRGVLFLDEMPEFPRDVVEALRQPMENGEVVVSRASGSVKFPSSFMLVGAMNPCPCGNYGQDKKPCLCTPQLIYRYQRKLSGPMLDRIDIQILVPQETYEKISAVSPKGPTSAEIREVVGLARNRQAERFQGLKFQTNSEMGPKEITKFCRLTDEANSLLKTIMTDGLVSGRGYHKILKVARTIADIAESDLIDVGHIAEAAGYRVKQGNDSLVS